MIDKEKLDILLNDKRTSPRNKLILLMLEKGYDLQKIIHFPVDNLHLLKEVNNGEELLKKYISRKGVMDRMVKTGLLFAGMDNKPIKESSLLANLRKPCRLNGFQLYELGFDGLVDVPSRMLKTETLSLGSIDEIQSYIRQQQSTSKSQN